MSKIKIHTLMYMSHNFKGIFRELETENISRDRHIFTG